MTALALAAIVATLAGAAHPVQCVPVRQFNQDAGYAPSTRWQRSIVGGVWNSDHHIELSDTVCMGLAGIRPHRLPTIVQAVSVFVLAHEIGHELYGPDEQTADRYGLAHAAAVAWLLGLRSRDGFVELRDFIDAYAPLHEGVTP